MTRWRLIGFTGTREGMTTMQVAALLGFLGVYVDSPWLFHFGDCVGADEQAFEIAKEAGAFTVAHPPIDPTYRAFCPADRVLPLEPYLERDRNIVVASEVLVATPKQEHEVRRSGTWSTVRIARALSRPHLVIKPSGDVFDRLGLRLV